MWLNDTIFISGGGRSSGGVAATAGTSARDGVPTFASMTPCWRQQPWVLFAVCDEHNRQIFYIGSRDMSSCVLGSKTVLIYCDVGTSSVAFMATKNRYFWQEMSSCVCANKTGCFSWDLKTLYSPVCDVKSWDVSRCDCGDINGYFKPQQELLLA